jgi:alkyl hydroperoxide reductase subunit F
MVYDLIIVGGGPAGITAGIYASRSRLKTLLITKSFGGQMARKAVSIENYPGFEEISGAELIERFVNHLKKQKIEILEDEVTKVEKKENIFFVTTKGKKVFQSLTVIVASGADPRILDVEGERELIGKGVSYCTSCDGPLFKGKDVAVIGGGNAGFEAAIFLANFAKKIYILEFGDEVKAFPENQEKAKKTGKIEVITNAALKKIEGKNFVEAIIYEDRKEKKDKRLEVQGVFIEIGSQPATSFVKDLVKFNHFLNRLDEIEIDPRTCQTKTPGLFAAGDVTDVKFKQIVIACGEGAKAALSAYEYLRQIKK